MIVVLLFSLLTFQGDFRALADAANSARESGRVAESVELYRRALAVQPDWEEGWFYLGTSLYSTDDYVGSIGALEYVLRKHPKNGVAWAFTGLSQFELNHPDEALAALEKARKFGVGDNSELEGATLYELAVLLNARRRFDEGRSQLELLVRHGSEQPAVVIALGCSTLLVADLPARLDSGQREACLSAGAAAADAVRQRPEDADRKYRALIEKFPTTPNVHYAYGLFLLKDHPDDAIAQFRREIATHPEHVPARLQIADEFLRRGDADAALAPSREAVNLGPDWYLTHQMLGRVLLVKEDGAAAAKELEKAAKLRPDEGQNFFYLARAYALMGANESAAKARAKFRELESAKEKPAEGRD